MHSWPARINKNRQTGWSSKMGFPERGLLRCFLQSVQGVSYLGDVMVVGRISNQECSTKWWTETPAGPENGPPHTEIYIYIYIYLEPE